MAIKGISDIDRLPRLGKIRLGIKEKNASGKEYPEKIDYFLLDPDDESILASVREVYGEKPKALDIMFASESPEQVFPQYLKRYSFGTLACKGDGEEGIQRNFSRQTVGSKDQMVRGEDTKVKCEGCTYRRQNKCRPLASLMFLLPKIPGIGCWQLDTGSFHSITTVNAGLKLVKQMYGRLSGVPIKLLLTPRAVTVDGRAKTVYVLSLSIDGTLQDALSKSSKDTLPPAAVALPLPDEERADDHFPPEDDGEETGKTFEETVADNQKEFDKLLGGTKTLATVGGVEFKRRVLGEQAERLKYSPAEMISFMKLAFGKEASKDLTEGELDIVIENLGRVINLVEFGTKAFTRKELEDGAKKIHGRNNLMELSFDEEKFKAYDAMIRRATGGKKGV
jgi:hypothetical protein